MQSTHADAAADAHEDLALPSLAHLSLHDRHAAQQQSLPAPMRRAALIAESGPTASACSHMPALPQKKASLSAADTIDQVSAKLHASESDIIHLAHYAMMPVISPSASNSEPSAVQGQSGNPAPTSMVDQGQMAHDLAAADSAQSSPFIIDQKQPASPSKNAMLSLKLSYYALGLAQGFALGRMPAR